MACWKSHCLVVVISFLLTATDARITDLFARSVDGERITMTNEGCKVSFICQGIGATAVWRVFGNREPLQTSNNIQVITPVPLDESTNIQGEIIFNPILANNSGAYTCTIGTRTRTVRISVSDPVSIVPGNLEYDISDFVVGTTFPVICVVETCLDNLRVAVRRDNRELHQLLVRNSRDNPQFNLEVLENIEGQHDCHATYTFRGVEQSVASVPFNVTGKPSIPVTTAAKDQGGSSANIVSPLFTLLAFSMTLFMALLT